jgi:signal transduction histidine kinase
MSEQDFFKKLWSSVAISIVTIVLTAVITMLLSYKAQSERINNAEKGLVELKDEMKTKVSRGEYEGIIQMLNEQDKELSQKIDKNQEVIVKFLFDIKNEIK